MAKVKNFFKKVGLWFKNHAPSKRRLIQLYAALLVNANLKGYITGKIYTGNLKNLCSPGLNCYSCPGASFACPLGALQDSMAQTNDRAAFYIIGILALFGLTLARTICGFLCPVGLGQELLYKIKTPKLKKSRYTRVLSFFKYVLLAVMVIAIPLIYHGIPAFCKYVCPAGTFEGAGGLLANSNNAGFFAMLGNLFTWKFCLLVIFIVGSVFVYRFFCRFFCPLGAIYGFFNKWALIGVKLDEDKCVDCGMCIQTCKMDIRHVGDHECINCGECVSVCPTQAISWKGSKIFVKGAQLSSPAPVAETAAPLAAVLENGSAGSQPSVQEEDTAPIKVFPEEGADLPASELVEHSKTSAAAVLDSVTVEPRPEATTAASAAAAAPAKARRKFRGGVKGAGIKTAVKNPKFVVELCAWVCALALLIVMLVCYNLPEKPQDRVPDFTLKTYKSLASDGGEYSNNSKTHIKVIYFWSTDIEVSVTGMSEINKFYQNCRDEVEVVAIHCYYKDDRDVQSCIDEQGWNNYNITFAQDNMDVNIYSWFGGDISVPKPITAVTTDGLLHSKFEGEKDGAIVVPTADELFNMFAAAKRDTVFSVGDRCPDITLKTYKSAGTCDGEGNLTYEEFSTMESRGTVTVINFWYTTCDPCVAELPYFEKVRAEFGDQIIMVAVHSATAMPKGGAEGVQSFINSNGWNDYGIVFAQDTEEIACYNMLGGSGAYPTTVIIDKNGHISYFMDRPVEEDELRNEIAKLL